MNIQSTVKLQSFALFNVHTTLRARVCYYLPFPVTKIEDPTLELRCDMPSVRQQYTAGMSINVRRTMISVNFIF